MLIYIQQDNGLYLMKLISKDYLDKVFSIFQAQLVLDNKANTNNNKDPNKSKEDKIIRA